MSGSVFCPEPALEHFSINSGRVSTIFSLGGAEWGRAVLKIVWAGVAIYPGERRSVGFFNNWTSGGKFLSTGIVSHVTVYLSAAMLRRRDQINTKLIHSDR